MSKAETTIHLMSDSEVDDLFKAHGGRFHGPRIETATIAQADFYRFIEAVISRTAQDTLRQIAKERAHA